MLNNEWTKDPFTLLHAEMLKMKLEVIHSDLPAFHNMTTKEKQGCVKVGLPQLGLIRMSKRICEHNPKVLPRWHEHADYYAICESVESLLVMQGAVASLLEEIETALMGAEDDAVRISLDYYYNLKRAAKSSSMSGLKGKVKEIRDTFKKVAGKALETMHPEVVKTEDDSEA